jgi:hypothetical protein
MNERIRELLIEAGVYECDVNDPEFVVPEEQKKFAQFIIRECMTVGFNAVYNAEDDSHAVAVYKEIKQHFGVEQ